MRKFQVVCLVISLVFLLGCFQTPTEIKIEPQKVELYEQGGTAALRITVSDQKGKTIDKVKLQYSCEDNSIASVDETGKVTAQMSGETNITVSTKKISKTVPVFVRIVDKLKLDFPTPGVYEAMGPEKSVLKLLVTARNENGNDVDLSILKFKSSDPKIASVNGQGELTILNDGKVTITAEIGKKKVTLDVPVMVLRPSAIKVDSPRFSVGTGETAFLPFTVISTKGTALPGYPVKVVFDKEGIASADEKGNVTGIAKGTAIVTITAGEAVNTLTLQVR
jgi:uncharacterized protein YjdB